MPRLENEKELEMYLFNHPEEGHPINLRGKKYKQFNIPPYGTIDLMSVEETPDLLTITIVELKQAKIDYNAVGQISRYRTAINRLFCHDDHFDIRPIQVNGILIGSEICKGDSVYLFNELASWLGIYTYTLDLAKGIFFKPVGYGWHVPSEDFSKIKPLVEYKKMLP